MQILYVASSNPGKLRDFAAVPNLLCQLLPLPNLGSIPEPEETASTFAGNARIKALAYAQLAPGEIVLADDSGLEVDGLGGAPGVRSARYAEDHPSAHPSDHALDAAEPLSKDARNNQCLLARAAALAAHERKARFRCVLAAARNNEVLAYGQGTLEGLLLDQPRGTGGFGYDPLFLLPELGRTMAELDSQSRLLYSHRVRAFADLMQSLRAAGF